MKATIKKIVKERFFEAPKKFKKKQVQFNPEQLKDIKESIEKNYLDRGTTKASLSQKEYNLAIQGQLHKRLYYNRNRIIPFLSRYRSLDNSKILEIGCGTGISTLALAEQGAKVTGIDVDQGALDVARDRLKIAGMEADFHFVNAEDIKERFGDQKFDFIIYYAVLEHMTVKERLSSLKQAWEMLTEDTYLVVLETPNRLWYYDSHTAALPFYDWLPDDLAFYYSKFSKRKNFKDLYREINDDNMLSFLRWGKGASYHEFEIAIAPLEKLNVVDSLMQFEKTAFLKLGDKGLRYINFLRSQKKNLPKAFCYPYLDIILKK